MRLLKSIVGEIMQCNIHPCPHCNGTGKVQYGWFALISENKEPLKVVGPYQTEDEVKRQVPDYIRDVHVYYEKRVIS